MKLHLGLLLTSLLFFLSSQHGQASTAPILLNAIYRDSITQIGWDHADENVDSPATPADRGIECDCTLTGAYIAPASPVLPRVIAGATSPHGIYKLTVMSNGNFATLTIIRASTNQEVLKLQNISADQWGFSPDDDRFVYHSSLLGKHFVYNLTSPSVPLAEFTDGLVLFSPNGIYTVHIALVSATNTILVIMDARTGVIAYQDEFNFVVPPGAPGDQFGVVQWGFSPDSFDRTFVLGYVSGQTSVQRNLVNLPTKQIIQSETVLFTSAFWHFSPCGDVVGIVSQLSQTLLAVQLNHTLDGSLLSGSNQTLSLGTVVLSTTTDQHTVALNNGTPVNLAANMAGQTCQSNITITALTVAPTSVAGGQSATGTITLNQSAPTGTINVQLTSNNPTLINIPNTVNLPVGAQSTNFVVQTHSPPIDTVVTISANYGGQNKSADLMVRAAMPETPTVDALLFTPAALTGWNSTQGKITLKRVARSGGELVYLTSSNSLVLSVPTTVMIPAGLTEATFWADAQPVSSDTPVTITAALAESTKTTVVTVLRPTITNFALPDSSMKGGNSVEGTVELNGDAPTGGIVVFLISSEPILVSLPISITVEEGRRSTGPLIETMGVASPISVTLTATESDNAKSASLTLLPADLENVAITGPCLVEQDGEGATLVGGQPAELLLSLDGAAPASGANLTLESSNSSLLAVPASVSVQPQRRVVTATIVPNVVQSPTRVVLSAHYRDVERSLSLTLTHAMTYTIIDLGEYRPAAINNASQIVASDKPEGDPEAHTVIWQRGVVTDLGSITLPALGVGHTVDINDKGMIIGVTIYDQKIYSWLWQNDMLTSIDVSSPYTFATASTINNSGQVLLNIDNIRAVRWQNGAVTDLLPLPDYPESYGYDLNNWGDVAGISSKLSLSPLRRYTHATLWQSNVISDLGTIYGYWDSAEALAINDIGEIAMIAPARASFPYPHTYIQAGSEITLLTTPPGYDYNQMWPTAINNRGTVIGYLAHRGDFAVPDSLFLYDKQATYQLRCTLPSDSGWELSEVVDLNDADEIVGIGVRNDGNEHGFLLTQERWTEALTQTRVYLPAVMR